MSGSSDEVVGFGPIEFLLKDPDVTEVMANGPGDVYVERNGTKGRETTNGEREGSGGCAHHDREHVRLWVWR